MKNKMGFILRLPLKLGSILIIKWLQRKYKFLSIKNRHHQTNRTLYNLILIQHILFYFKNQFHAWGYFHPSCVWTKKSQSEFKELFPTKDFEEIDVVVWHNPEAVNYYQDRIYYLKNQKSINYSSEIKKHLLKIEKWN